MTADERIRREARISGLRADLPSLEQVERRRFELSAITTVLIVLLSAAMVLLSVSSDLQAEIHWINPAIMRGGVIALVCAFGIYSIEKQWHLRRLTGILVNERLIVATLSDRINEIGALLDAGKAVNSVHELDRVLAAVLRGALDLLPAAYGTVMLIDPMGQLRVFATAGDGGEPSAEPVVVGEGLAGRVAATREPALVNGLIQRRASGDATRIDDESAMCVPLVCGDELFGVLDVRAVRGETFTEYHLRALSVFAEQAAAAVSKARLLQESRQHAAELAHLAMHDPLTHLANRILLTRRTKEALQSRSRSEKVALFYLDLDGFKKVNDRLGHGAGDELLIGVARRLSECLRPGDLSSRLGGDEFAVLLENVDTTSTAVEVAQRILDELSFPFACANEEVFVTTSIGIALAGGPGDQVDDLLRRADAALYAAKDAGKNRYVIAEASTGGYPSSPSGGEVQRAQLEGEFVLHYQPFLRLHDTAIVAVEALLRWDHPTRGLLMPGEFLRGLLETGAIADVGAWSLREACRQLRDWRAKVGAAAPSWIAVNVSARQLHQPDFVQHVRQALQDASLPATSLVLDVTEDVVLRDAERSYDILEQLRATGVRVAIDDFGTGYSSLTNLLELPIDVLKIDQSFVHDLVKRPHTRALVEAVVSIADQMQIMTIAEGVENGEQLAAVRGVGCRLMQGYQLTKPLPAGELIAFIEQHNRGKHTIGASGIRLPSQVTPEEHAAALADLHQLAQELDRGVR